LITDWSKRFGCLISSLFILKDPSFMIQPWRTWCYEYTLMEMFSSVSGKEETLIAFGSHGL
jgi:hypothetical protein